MDTRHYLNLFQQSLESIDKKAFSDQQLDAKVGVWLNSVVLKIQGKDWYPTDAKPFSTGIFFSVWVSDDTISNGKIYYNTHALKLRDLKAYRLQSREFADAFRNEFKAHEQDWPNVNTKFGALTLMEGWVPLNDKSIERDVTTLAQKFLALAPITHKLLAERKK